MIDTAALCFLFFFFSLAQTKRYGIVWFVQQAKSTVKIGVAMNNNDNDNNSNNLREKGGVL